MTSTHIAEGHGARNGAPTVHAAPADALFGLDLARCAVARDLEPAVELAITFADGAGEDGVGTTRTVSPKQVRFTTSRQLETGCRISGVICFLPGPDGVATDLSYVACVTAVAPTADDACTFEVTARFEQLAFSARQALGSTSDPAD